MLDFGNLEGNCVPLHRKIIFKVTNAQTYFISVLTSINRMQTLQRGAVSFKMLLVASRVWELERMLPPHKYCYTAQMHDLAQRRVEG